MEPVTYIDLGVLVPIAGHYVWCWWTAKEGRGDR